MATQPPRDDQQPGGPKSDTPKPPPAKPVIPNMSLDDPDDIIEAMPASEVLDVEVVEVVEDEHAPHPAETTSQHDIALPPPEDDAVFEAMVVSEDDDVFPVEEVEVVSEAPIEEVSKPESDVLQIDAADKPPLARTDGAPDDGAESASAVMEVDESALVAEEAGPAQAMDSPVPQPQAPISDVVQISESAAILSDAPTEMEVGTLAHTTGPATEAVADMPAQDVVAEAILSAAAEADVPPGSAVIISEEPAGVAPTSDVAAEALLDEQVAIESPSAIVIAATTAPTSDVAAAALLDEAAIESEPAIVGPTSDIAAEALLDESAADVISASGIVIAETAEPVGPTSDVAAEALLGESAADVQPESAFIVAETASEVIGPTSDVAAEALLDDSAADVEPGSAIIVAETAGEPAAPASDVAAEALFDETPSAAVAPTSNIAGDALLDDAVEVEAASEPVAPTSDFAAEALLDDAADLEPASIAEISEASGTETTEPLAPTSDVAAEALLDDAVEAGSAIVIAETSETPIEIAAPASDVAMEALLDDSAPVEATSAVVVAETADDAAPASDLIISEATTEGPPSDLVADAEEIDVTTGSAAIISEAADADELLEEALPASEIIAEAAASSDDDALLGGTAEVTEAVPAEEAIEALYDVGPDVAAEASASDLAADALFEEVAEISEVGSAEDVVFDDESTEAAAAALLARAEGSEVVEAAEEIEEVVEAAEEPEEIVEEVEEAIEAVAEEAAEAAPVSAIAEDALLSEDDIEEAVEASAIADDLLLADDEVEEIIEEAAPASAVADELLLTEEDVEEAVEASAVDEAEEVEELEAIEDDLLVAEEEVLEEEIAEAAPASEIAEIADDLEVVEEAEEVSSATRKSESVFDEELIPPGSSAAVAADSDVKLEAEPTPKPGKRSGKKKKGPDSGTVFYDEGVAARDQPLSGTEVDFDRTVAFDPVSGARKSSQPDSLVTEEELAASSEGSAVNLGEMPSRKGPSPSGIDPVAEALESGIEVNDPHTSPSVEFDELLDDSTEHEIKAAKSKKGKRADDGSTEMESEPLPPPSKKGKKEAIAQTGDDVDLDDLFADDAEPAEAVEEDADAEPVEAFDEEEAALDAFADEAEEAEALDEDAIEAAEDADEDIEAAAAAALDDDDAISFDDEPMQKAAALDDDEVEAAEALDDEDMDLLDDEERPTKTKPGKKPIKAAKKTSWDEDEDEIKDSDEEEDTSAKKKKGKKEKAVPAPARPGRALPMMAGMFVGGLLLAGGLVAGLYFFPDEIRDAADQVKEGTRKAPVVVNKAKELTRAQKARLAMDEGDYAKAVGELQGELNDPGELNTRAEAQWLAYYKQQADQKQPLDRKAPPVESALKDLEKAKELDKAKSNTVLAGQITEALDLREKLDALQTKSTKELAELKMQREAAEKFIDAVGKVFVDAGILKKDPDAKDGKVMYDAALVKKVVDDYGDKKTMLAVTEKTLKETEEKKLEAETKVAAVDKVLEGEKTKEKGDKGVLEIIAGRDTLKKDRDSLTATLKTAFQELVDGKIVPDGDAVKEIIQGAKIARQKAESPLSIPLAQIGMSLGSVGTGSSKLVEDAFKQAELLAKLSYYKGLAELGDSPDQKMDTHVVLLQDRKKNDKVELDLIRNQTDWLLGNSKHLETRGKARYVQALIDRNRENFKDARTAIDDALKLVRPLEKTGVWTKLAEQSKRELTDPYVYFLPRMHKFLDEGNAKAALEEANLALKALPDEGRLFAQRGLIQFEMVRGKGGKIADEAQKAIRADADEAAVKNEKLAAEAAYLKGLLEEELGRLSEAEKLYREAIDLHKAGKGMPEDAAKHRLALGRLLLRDRTEAAPVIAPPPPPNDDKKGEKAAEKVGAARPPHPQPLSPEGRGETLVIHPWTTLVLGVTLGQVVEKTEKEKEEEARFEEARKFAEELIEAGRAAKDKKVEGQGHILLGHAYSKLGRRTQGLKEFARGIELLMPANIKIDEPSLSTLIEEHPAFQQPDLSHIQNEVIAQRHFGEGLHLYWSKNYVEAERQFMQAVKWFNQDARYQYFLGLAQFNQQSRLKRDAAFVAWEQGARIEAKQPTRVGEINRSLERVQGDLRQVLNTHRYKGIAEITDR